MTQQKNDVLYSNTFVKKNKQTKKNEKVTVKYNQRHQMALDTQNHVGSTSDMIHI